jgi:hypothetical protein
MRMCAYMRGLKKIFLHTTKKSLTHKTYTHHIPKRDARVLMQVLKVRPFPSRKDLFKWKQVMHRGSGCDMDHLQERVRVLHTVSA